MRGAEHFWYFGYGSLVNRGTLPPGTEAVRAVLKGFRRGWRSASPPGEPGYCSLSIEPSEGDEVAGLLVTERVEELGRLDERERRYHRHTLPADRLVMPDGGDPPATFVTYRAMARHNHFGSAACPATLSYADTVAQGFLQAFGEEGVRAFVAGTDGWDLVPFLDDRAAPLYQRAQPVSDDERRFFDDLFVAAGMCYLPNDRRGVVGGL